MRQVDGDPLPSSFLFKHADQRGKTGVERRARVADRVAEHLRWTVFVAADASDTGHGLGRAAKANILALRTPIAEGGERHHHKLGIHCREHLVIYP